MVLSEVWATGNVLLVQFRFHGPFLDCSHELCDCAFILETTGLCESRNTVLHTQDLLSKCLVGDSVIGLLKQGLFEACTLFLPDFGLAGPVHPSMLLLLCSEVCTLC